MNLQSIKDRLARPAVYEVSLSEVRWLIERLEAAEKAIDTSTWFYKNCKRQRRNAAKICQVCPFRAGIEVQEAALAGEE